MFGKHVLGGISAQRPYRDLARAAVDFVDRRSRCRHLAARRVLRTAFDRPRRRGDRHGVGRSRRAISAGNSGTRAG